MAAVGRPERLHDPGMPRRHRDGTVVIQGPPGHMEGHHQKVAPGVPLVLDESNVAAVGRPRRLILRGTVRGQALRGDGIRRGRGRGRDAGRLDHTFPAGQRDGVLIVVDVDKRGGIMRAPLGAIMATRAGRGNGQAHGVGDGSAQALLPDGHRGVLLVVRVEARPVAEVEQVPAVG